jgi:hypothetical protein
MVLRSRSVLIGGGNLVMASATSVVSGAGLRGEMDIVSTAGQKEIDFFSLKGHYFEAGSTKVYWNDGVRARRKTSETIANDNWAYEEKNGGIIEFRWELNANEPIHIDYTIASSAAVVE